MALIGVYRVSRKDLQKPESEQTWRREAAVDTDAREWVATSDSAIIEMVDSDKLVAALNKGDDAVLEYLLETCSDNSRAVLYAADAKESDATIVIEEPDLSYLQSVERRRRWKTADEEVTNEEIVDDLRDEPLKPTPIPAPPLYSRG